MRPISGPSTRIASRGQRPEKKSWLRIGARSAAQIGNPGTKLSGNAISDAPLPAASSIRLDALSIVRALSRNIGAVWQAAALKLG